MKIVFTCFVMIVTSVMLTSDVDAQGVEATSARERARAETMADIERVWRQSGKTEPLRLVVIEEGTTEYLRIFSEGMDHLPAQLISRCIYRTTRERGSRRVQYLGKRRAGGYRWVLFRWIDGEQSQSPIV